MKTTHSVSQFAPLILASAFALFLLYDTLSGIEFPRGLIGPPTLADDSSYWGDFSALNPNLVWTFHYDWYLGDGDREMYLEFLDRYGMQSVLRWGDWSDRPRMEWNEHYATSQFDRYEVELDSATAKDHYFDVNGTGYCFFEQREGTPDLTTSYWQLFTSSHEEDTVLVGPKETVDGLNHPYRTPRFDWPYPPKFSERVFQHRIKARAITEGIDDNTTAFKMYLDHFLADSSFIRVDSLIVRAGDFIQSDSFQVFSLDDTIASGAVKGAGYKIYWPDSVDLWIDWIEFWDMDRGYYLFSPETQDSILGMIVDSCRDIEQSTEYPDAIAGWSMSDEPIRASFRPHYVVADTMMKAGLKTPRTPFRELWDYQRVKTFANIAQLPVIDCDKYIFYGIDSTGDQSELDTLALHLERAYQESQLQNMGFQFFGTVTAYWDSSELAYRYRHVVPSEIFAEAFMALAHGAKGVTFYKYRSQWDYGTGPSAGDSSIGLVDPGYDHSHEPYASKWQAVQDIFTQLDSIGNTLLSLERDTAFCALNGGFQSPITNIYFEDDDEDYIEVGQFDSSGTGFLILVNRRTDHDRHITVETNKTGPWALRDIYTQEQFISSTGNFEWIPFDSGEGKVFRLEPPE